MLSLSIWHSHSSVGDRTFVAAGSQVWNSLPPNLRLCRCHFRRSLKTFLVKQLGHGAVWTVLTMLNRSIFTYLLTYLPVKSINTGRAEFCDVCVAIDTVCSPYPSLNLKWLRFSSCCCTDLKQSSSAYHICSVAWRRTSSNSVTCNYTWRRLHSCWRTETTCWWS